MSKHPRRLVIVIIVGLVAGALSIGACGGLEPDDPEVLASGGKGDGVEARLPVSGPHRLTLHSNVVWTHRQTGEKVDAVTVIDALVEADGELLRVRPCQVWLPQQNGYQPYLSERTLASIPPAEMTLTGTAAAFESSAATIRHGLGRTDGDADGKAGVTVRIGDWQIYAGFEIAMKLRGGGAMEPGGALRASGAFDFELRQEIYGDTIAVFFGLYDYDAAAELETFKREHELSRETNRFELVPLHPSVTRCAGLR